MMDESGLHDHRPPIIGFILLLLLLPHSTVTEVTHTYRTHSHSLKVIHLLSHGGLPPS